MNWEAITAVAQVIIALAAVIGIYSNVRQLRIMQKQLKTEAFIRYCSHYSMSPEVLTVVKYLEKLVGLSHKDDISTPDGHDIEIFMRYFEEIEHLIEVKILDEQVVFDLFSYYLFVFENNIKEFNITDYDSESWSKFRLLLQRLERIRKKSATELPKGNVKQEDCLQKPSKDNSNQEFDVPDDLRKQLSGMKNRNVHC